MPVSSFLRDFFRYLEGRGVQAVVLHGYQTGFADTRSDVDFAMNARDFLRLRTLIQAFCAEHSWMLCQSLDHEISALYAVCCASDDPSRVVLLDGCADYRVRGHRVMTSAEMLEGRRRLDWGGFGPAGDVELRYLFAKAAAKRKAPGEVMEKLGTLACQHGDVLREWLGLRYGVDLAAWNREAIGVALESLSAKLARPRWGKAQLALKLGRIRRPRGLWFEPNPPLEEDGLNLAARFFRATEVVERMVSGSRKMALVRKLFGSTLVVVPARSAGERIRTCLSRRDLYFTGTPKALVAFLAAREQKYVALSAAHIE